MIRAHFKAVLLLVIFAICYLLFSKICYFFKTSGGSWELTPESSYGLCDPTKGHFNFRSQTPETPEISCAPEYCLYFSSHGNPSMFLNRLKNYMKALDNEFGHQIPKLNLKNGHNQFRRQTPETLEILPFAEAPQKETGCPNTFPSQWEARNPPRVQQIHFWRFITGHRSA